MSRESAAEYRRKNPDNARAASNAWWQKNGATYRAANKEKIRKSAAKHSKKNLESINARTAKWRAENPAKQRSAEVAYRSNNLEKRKASCKAYRDANPEKEREYRKAYAKANKPKLNAKASRRRASKLKATPTWADLNAIIALYAEAARLTAETGIPHHVDHIVPLQSKNVCGLHWEGNLQILIGTANVTKGNRRWPDMP